MSTVEHSSKNVVLRYLASAYEGTLKEQDHYRELFNQSMDNETSDTIKAKISEEGWKAVLEIMQDCYYPPENDERGKFLKISHDQELNHLILEKIADKQIRHKTYFFNELMEQTQRIKAMAMFCKRIGKLDGRGEMVFNFWMKRSSMQIIHEEAVEMGLEDRAISTQQVIDATDKMADLIISEEDININVL